MRPETKARLSKPCETCKRIRERMKKMLRLPLPRKSKEKKL